MSWVKEFICISSYISTIGEAAFNICDISDTIIEKINFSDNNIALTINKEFDGIINC